eukprot:338408-Rhodomonas_salina.1
MVWSEVALAFLYAPGSSLDVSSAALAHTCPARPPQFRLAGPTHSRAPASNQLSVSDSPHTHARTPH